MCIHIMGEAGCSMVFVSRVAYTCIYSVHYTHTHTHTSTHTIQTHDGRMPFSLYVSVCLPVRLSLSVSLTFVKWSPMSFINSIINSSISLFPLYCFITFHGNDIDVKERREGGGSGVERG